MDPWDASGIRGILRTHQARVFLPRPQAACQPARIGRTYATVMHTAENIRAWIDRLSSHPESGVFRLIPTSTRGSLFVSPMPFGAYDKGNRLLRSYRSHHVREVFILTDDEEVRRKTRRNLKAEYEAIGASWRQYPFQDLQAPEMVLMRDFVLHAVAGLARHNIAVHCHAGVGRTSIAVCCILQITEGLPPEGSLAFVRRHMEVNMTPEQKAVVMQFTPSGGR